MKVKRKKDDDNLKHLIKEKENAIVNGGNIDDVDKKISDELKKQKEKETTNEMENLFKIKEIKGQAAAISKLKEKVLGKKKESCAPTAVIDPTTGKKIFDKKDIIDVCADYCVKLLTNREPSEGYEEDIRMKRIVHNARMNEAIENDVQFSEEIFQNTFSQLKTKPGNKYDFIIKAGPSLHGALYKLYDVVWTHEVKPDKWRDTVLVQLPKSKGDRFDLNSKRHIHLRSEIQKFFEHMVTSIAKPMIVKNMSPFQIGAVPGHRSQEHLYVVKSVVAMLEECNEATAIQLFDYSKFFDSEQLVDGLGEIYRSDVRGKPYRLLYELNRDTRIRVRTPAGESDKRETNENIGQGSISGSLISSSSLSAGVTDFFSSSESETSFGTLKLLPQSFLDDLLRFCRDPLSAQHGNDRFQNLAEMKLLSYNMTKTCVIFMGAKKAREELEQKFIEEPPTLFGEPVKLVNAESYLGDSLGKTASESVSLTINKREGLAKKAIFDIKNIIDDCRSKVIGGISTGLLLWESCVLPFLLFNCSTWIRMKNSDVERLCKIQNLFFNVLLQTQKCSVFFLHWELGALLIPLRILKEKLMFYHHICCLSENSLAFQIKSIQEKLSYPCLREEIQHFLNEFEIHDVRTFSKREWKTFVRDKIYLKNRETLLEMAKGLKKADYISLSCEEFKIKTYFSELNLENARMKFRIRSSTINTCRSHAPSDPANLRAMHRCFHCMSQDTPSHFFTCPAYQHLLLNKDRNSDVDVCEFFKAVIRLRLNPEP